MDLAPQMAPLPPVALYVHVPFCVAKCPYCDFVVYAGAEARGPRARTAQLFEALAVELALRADAVDAAFERVGRPPLRSIYFGGGTPSLMPAAQVARLIGMARDRFGLAPDAEVTLEANPGPDEIGDMAAFAKAGVNRVSLGAQSFVPGELKRLGRRHSPADIANSVGQARAAGIQSLNLDLLYDVPGQTEASWLRSLTEALALEPDHLSLYALTLDDPDEEGLTGETDDHLPTPSGARRWREKATADQDDDRAAGQYEAASSLLETAGWHHYEISNWARPGHESRHNLAYWLRDPYEGIGPGAHAFDGLTRRWNVARMEPYLESLAGRQPGFPTGGSDLLDERAAAAERLILALRTDAGVPTAWTDDPRFTPDIEWALDAGLLEPFTGPNGSCVRLTVRGYLLSNELFARLV